MEFGLAFVALVVVVVLLLVSTLCSLIETSFSSLNLIKVKQEAKGGNKRAILAFNIYKDFSSALTAILVVNTIANTFAASLAAFVFATLFGGLGVIIATGVMTVLIVTFCEIIPKIFAKENAERIALRTARILRIMIAVNRPIVGFFRGIEKKFKEKHKTKRVTATENELLEIIRTIEAEGVLNQDERDLIENAITFDDKKVRDVMTKENDTIFVYEYFNEGEIRSFVGGYRYSRFPVLSRKTGKVIGLIHENDVLNLILRDQRFTLRDILREPLFVPADLKVPLALQKIQKRKAHMAIVVNNLKDKDVVGIVTVEDILEELVGEIYDEYDNLPANVVRIGLHDYEVNPNVKVADFFRKYVKGVKAPKTQAETFNGWIKELANKELADSGKKCVLRRGCVFTHENVVMKVLSVSGGNVEKLDVEILSRKEEL